MTHYSLRIHKAFDFAAIAHQGQTRKDPDITIPYFSHLAGVAQILAEHGFSEDVVIAGVLHDLIEDVIDKGHPDYENKAKGEFGEDVYSLVDWVSQRKKDQDGNKIAWEIRGLAYIDRLNDAPNDAKAISCADKIHNMQSIILAIERGVPIWDHLKASRDTQIHKFQSLHTMISSSWKHPIVDDLQKHIELLKTKLVNT